MLTTLGVPQKSQVELPKVCSALVIRHELVCSSWQGRYTHNMIFKIRHGTVAQSAERPSKVPVWWNSTDVGSNH